MYGIIADLRREHPTPAVTQTLDMVVEELGHTRDNLKEAVAALSTKSLPPGGKPILDELVERARKADLYDLDYGKDYKYAHEYYKEMQIEDPERPPAVQIQEYLPESLNGRRYYEPGHQGKEASIKKWLEKRRGEEG